MSENRAVEILKRYETGVNARAPIVAQWDRIAKFCRPSQRDWTGGGGGVLVERPRETLQLFDSEAMTANLTYAAGVLSWMTPADTPWFVYSAPDGIDDDEVKSWFSACTDVARRELAISNFYTSIHECYLDDGAFGTCGILIDETESGELRFENLSAGSFVAFENASRQVDTLFRSMSLTHRQAAQKFGAENLPNEVQQKIAQSKGEGQEERRTYIHCIMPRTDYQAGKLDGKNMPWASLYICQTSKKIVGESGFWEQPFAVHRHLLWGDSAYGFGPGFVAFWDAQQLDLMQEYLDTLIERIVAPPILVPASFEGKINLMAGGLTYYKSDDAKPSYWEDRGNYPAGLDRVGFRKQQIQAAFHVPLFQALQAVPVGKEMTAAEIRMRSQDRLVLFSPTFARKSQELIDPIIKRVFATLLRAGKLPEPPQSLEMNRDGQLMIPQPKINYQSRMALRLQDLYNSNFASALEQAMAYSQVAPEVVDHFDMDKATREMARNEGMNEAWLRPLSKVNDMRAARAAQQAEMMRQQSAMVDAQIQQKVK